MFAGLPRPQQLATRKAIVAMILKTDMSAHFASVTRFNSEFISGGASGTGGGDGPTAVGGGAGSGQEQPELLEGSEEQVCNVCNGFNGCNVCNFRSGPYATPQPLHTHLALVSVP